MGLLLLMVAAVAGAALTVQVACNTRLSQTLTSPVLATLCSFLVGSVALAVYVLATRQAVPPVGRLTSAPWWAWVGGLLGGAYVLSTILLTPRLGPGLLFGAIVAGQMVMAVALEHAGALGLARHPASLTRVAGVALIVAGVVLIHRRS